MYTKASEPGPGRHGDARFPCHSPLGCYGALTLSTLRELNCKAQAGLDESDTSAIAEAAVIRSNDVPCPSRCSVIPVYVLGFNCTCENIELRVSLKR
ncbi:hypothetical protein J6590_005538 [Homalodisca vitripennis]|nr:hypothetical protein J6590_005538 [Homalodisca vitripennis]